MPRLLTRRKQAWVEQFNPDVVLGKPLNPNAAVEARYYRELAALIDKMTAETEKEFKALFDTEHGKEYFGEDMSIASQARILGNEIKRKFDLLFAAAAPEISKRLAKQSDATSSTQLHDSIKQLSGGLSLPTTSLMGPLKDILTASIAENVALIKSISSNYFEAIQGAVMRSITTGNGLQDLVPFLADRKGVTLRRARFIAKDQTKKVFENLSTGRMESLGLTKFKWLHTGGSNHPRKTHIAMTGKIYKLDEGAYDSDVDKNVMPGELPGCRCRKVPILEFNDAT